MGSDSVARGFTDKSREGWSTRLFLPQREALSTDRGMRGPDPRQRSCPKRSLGWGCRCSCSKTVPSGSLTSGTKPKTCKKPSDKTIGCRKVGKKVIRSGVFPNDFIRFLLRDWKLKDTKVTSFFCVCRLLYVPHPPLVPITATDSRDKVWEIIRNRVDKVCS